MKATVDMLFPVVVAGVDGTERSAQALRWLAGEVADGGMVHLVHAVPPGAELAVAAVQADSRSLLDRVRRDLDGPWSGELRCLVGRRDVTVETHVVEDVPAHALLHVCERVGAAAIVVGAHSSELGHPRLLGRTIGQLVELSAVPVVIVPSTADQPSARSPVVVAVGAEPRSALQWAARYAAGHDVGISLVKAGHHPIFSGDGLIAVLGYHLDPGAPAKWAIEDLESAATEVQMMTADELDVSWTVPRRTVGHRLLEAGSSAGVMVIGRPRRTRGSATAVPAWLRRVVAHAPCPVVVVPCASRARRRD